MMLLARCVNILYGTFALQMVENARSAPSATCRRAPGTAVRLGITGLRGLHTQWSEQRYQERAYRSSARLTADDTLRRRV